MGWLNIFGKKNNIEVPNPPAWMKYGMGNLTQEMTEQDNLSNELDRINAELNSLKSSIKGNKKMPKFQILDQWVEILKLKDYIMRLEYQREIKDDKKFSMFMKELKNTMQKIET